tara:strand:- start:2193 stop:2654 length:462 start_codon:yes stop_codon:yes gene_type:complete
MTTRFVKPNPNLKSCGIIKLCLRNGLTIITDTPSEKERYQVFFDSEGNVYPLQEYYDKYGENSYEYKNLCKHVLSNNVEVYMAELNCKDSAVITNMTANMLELETKRKSFCKFSVLPIKPEDIGATLYMKIKRAFISQKQYFEGNDIGELSAA